MGRLEEDALGGEGGNTWANTRIFASVEAIDVWNLQKGDLDA